MKNEIGSLNPRQTESDLPVQNQSMNRARVYLAREGEEREYGGEPAPLLPALQASSEVVAHLLAQAGRESRDLLLHVVAKLVLLSSELGGVHSHE